MKKLLFVSLIVLSATFSVGELFGQTYTYNRNAANCDGRWGTAACWSKVNNTGPSGCVSSNSLFPPQAPTATGQNIPCQVNVIINEDIIFEGNASFGGGFNSITVLNNATLTFTGNVVIQSNRTINFVTNTGGKIRVNGSKGIDLTAGSNTVLNINGDGTGNVLTTNIDFANDVTINVNQGGSLIVDLNTFISGKDVSLNVKGFFRTGGDVKVTGNNARINVDTPGIVVVDGDFELTGQGGIIVQGTSEVEVGGDIKITNNTTFTVGDDASFRVCGTSSTSPTVPSTIINDVQFGNCRILPVELLNFESIYNPNQKSSKLTWSTAKENANSHFEIERSDKGINDFRKVGEIDGMGWKDTVTEYEYIDEKLPLSGGNLFYRIKQIDFDGKYTYSKVLAVRAEGVQATTGAWRAFPNPTLGDQLRISLLDRTQYDEEPITFRIVHPTLITQAITVNSENEMNDQLAAIIPRAPKGVLVVEIQWGQKVEHIKVLKK